MTNLNFEVLPAGGPEAAGPEDPTTPHWNLQVFSSRNGHCFADVYVDKRRETLPLRSSLLRSRLVALASQHDGAVPSPAKLSKWIAHLEAAALRRDAPQRDVYVRAAHAEGRVYVDLGDPTGAAIEVGPNGWQLADNPPVRFMRTPSTLPLDTPERGGSIESVRSLFDMLPAEEFTVLFAWLVAALVRDRQQPVLVLRGGEGSAKTTMMNAIQSLIDPRSSPLAGMPGTELKLLAAAADRFLLPIDNVSSMTLPMSDAVCRLVTGGSNQPVIINGIADLARRADFIDRAIFLDLRAISDRRRRSLNDFVAEFAKLRPKTLGVIFDAIALGLKNLPDTRLAAFPRMADFAIFAAACEAAYARTGTFLDAYQANQRSAVEALLDGDPVVTAVRTLVARRKTWRGTATELDALLRAMGGQLENGRGWPAEPRILANQLRERSTLLLKAGIEIMFDRAQDRARTRLISIGAANDTGVGVNEPREARKSASAPSADASSSEPVTPREILTAGSTAPTCVASVDAADGADADSETAIKQRPLGADRVVRVERMMRRRIQSPSPVPGASPNSRNSSRPKLTLPDAGRGNTD